MHFSSQIFPRYDTAPRHKIVNRNNWSGIRHRLSSRCAHAAREPAQRGTAACGRHTTRDGKTLQQRNRTSHSDRYCGSARDQCRTRLDKVSASTGPVKWRPLCNAERPPPENTESPRRLTKTHGAHVTPRAFSRVWCPYVLPVAPSSTTKYTPPPAQPHACVRVSADLPPPDLCPRVV